jgi:hypothetical protein
MSDSAIRIHATVILDVRDRPAEPYILPEDGTFEPSTALFLLDYDAASDSWSWTAPAKLSGYQRMPDGHRRSHLLSYYWRLAPGTWSGEEFFSAPPQWLGELSQAALDSVKDVGRR